MTNIYYYSKRKMYFLNFKYQVFSFEVIICNSDVTVANMNGLNLISDFCADFLYAKDVHQRT